MKLMTMMTTTSQQGTTILVQFSSLNLDAVRWALESIKDLFENNNKNLSVFINSTFYRDQNITNTELG